MILKIKVFYSKKNNNQQLWRSVYITNQNSENILYVSLNEPISKYNAVKY